MTCRAEVWVGQEHFIMSFNKPGEVHLDACLAPYVLLLNRMGVETLGGCCGHGEMEGGIVVSTEEHPGVTTVPLPRCPL